MAHVAELDENNQVIRVIVISNEYEPNVEDFATNLFGGTWVQTSYNGTIRKHFAGVGFYYSTEYDAFIAPKCHDEAILDEVTCTWTCGNEEHVVKLS